jgi:ABC-type cobalamin/Fe3+-siderophores transport system ATPase subunit
LPAAAQQARSRGACARQVIGMAGCGKTTLMQRMNAHLYAKARALHTRGRVRSVALTRARRGGAGHASVRDQP